MRNHGMNHGSQYPQTLYIPRELTDASGYRLVPEDNTTDHRAERIQREAVRAWRVHCDEIGIHPHDECYTEQRDSFIAAEADHIRVQEDMERERAHWVDETESEQSRWENGFSIQQAGFGIEEFENPIDLMVQEFVNYHEKNGPRYRTFISTLWRVQRDEMGLTVADATRKAWDLINKRSREENIAEASRVRDEIIGELFA